MDSYEKKYNELVGKMKKAYLYAQTDSTKVVLEDILPELNESEGEKIRKTLIRYMASVRDIDGIKGKDIIAWLEKQKPVEQNSEDKRIRKDIISYLQRKQNQGELDAPDWIAWLEKQGEQNSADKVELKFKVGNWYQCTKDFFGKGVTFDKNTAYYCAKEGCLQNEYGCHIAIVKDLYDNFKLWTIQDAKDGDVLTDHCDDYKNPLIFILKKFEKVDFGLAQKSDYSSYCFLSMSDRPRFKEGYFHHKHNIKPATKEQRDLLFIKMKEAGYEWDNEKKELKIKLKEPDVYEYELERIVDKLNEVIGKLGDIYEVLSKPFQFPYKDYTPPSSIPGMDVWYKTHGVEKVTPVTCETTNEVKAEDGKENDKKRTN